MRSKISGYSEVSLTPRQVDALPIHERYGIGVPLAAAFIGISRSRVYELLQDGTLQGVVVGGRRIVLVEGLLKMLGGAPSAKRDVA